MRTKHLIVPVLVLLAATALGAQSKELQVYFNDRPPLYIVKGDTGFLTEIVKLVLKEAKVNYKLVDLPSNRIIDYIKAGNEYGTGIGWFKNADRETWAQFSAAIYRDKPQVLVVNKAKSASLGASPTLEQALKSGLSLGRKDGYSFGTVIDEAIKTHNPKIVGTTVEIPQMLKMINLGRMDYTILGTEEATWLLKSDKELSSLQLVNIADAPPGNERFFMMSKAVEKSVLDRINVAIAKVIASPEYKALTTF